MDFEPDDGSLGDESILSRPIVVGYVFGPKKMSTMGGVMAEASKTRLETGPDNSPKVRYAEEAVSNEDVVDSEEDGHLVMQSETGNMEKTDESELRRNASTSVLRTQKRSGGAQSGKQKIVVFCGDKNHANLPAIVRHLRSSDEADDVESTGTCTASTSGSQWTATTTFPVSSTSSSSRSTPIRVSFVPLDPDIPFEEQHDGRLDIVLHKLTEDILCVSQLSCLCPSVLEMPIETLPSGLSRIEREAVIRVRRLCQFQRENPTCCVVDNPLFVKTLMSRADIARTLDQCLQDVKSSSGIPVSSPRFVVVESDTLQRPRSEHDIATKLSEAGIEFPIIAKPLTAAGTKASHSMSILLKADGISQVKESCLLQEYRNHDATLFKVYVLGDHVSVHRRRSLPNLPRQQDGCIAETDLSVVEFDSQRPYPRLEDFGYSDSSKWHSTTVGQRSGPETCTTSHRRTISRDEVAPIVDAIKSAFGLQLFGFDILVSSDQTDMLVVDVNYFPSYKEVPNFPALLATYLTDRAIQSRQGEGETVQQP